MRKLLAEAEELEEAAHEGAVRAERAAPLGEAASSPPLSGGGQPDAPRQDQTAPDAPLADTIDRLQRAVLEELATVEAMRAQLSKLPRRPPDAERTARTLSTLTDALQKLQRLRCGVPFSEPDDDDMPEDIDEFRFELARRIEAFVASRTEPSGADGDRSAEQTPD